MPQQSSGSGVIISEDGYIVTNNHVIDNADKVDVVLNDKRTLSAKVIGKDPSTDLALLKIDEKNLPFIYFGNSDSVKVGQWVLAVGNPFNLESTVTAGIVSAKGRNINIIKDKNNAAIESFIQTDAAVNPGNSGGALVSTSGELIGINSAIATPTGTYAGYSFAIPVNIVKKVIDDLTNYGVVQRAFLGINPEELTGEIADKEGLENLKGVYVGRVIEKGAAAEAGLQQGDVITKIDGKNISSVPELLESVGSKRPGDDIKIEYLRKGKMLESSVQLKNRDGNTKLISKAEVESEAFNSLGASFEELSSSEKSKYKIDSVVKISSILQGGKFAQTDIPQGFIVTRMNKKPIASVDDLKQELTNAKGNVMMEGIVPGYPGKYYFSFSL
jgi:Do/DeqQ family serine protease